YYDRCGCRRDGVSCTVIDLHHASLGLCRSLGWVVVVIDVVFSPLLLPSILG
ncbi:unnamed protein product, partial [Sphenostylis stenocarpa]